MIAADDGPPPMFLVLWWIGLLGTAIFTGVVMVRARLQERSMETVVGVLGFSVSCCFWPASLAMGLWLWKRLSDPPRGRSTPTPSSASEASSERATTSRNAGLSQAARRRETGLSRRREDRSF